MTHSVSIALALSVVLSGCALVAGEQSDLDIVAPDIDVASLETCEDIKEAIGAELYYIRYCKVDAQCGQVLRGTSCGCTRELVARLGVDTDRFYELLPLAADCGIIFVSRCDCPAADGFICVQNQCTWNYRRHYGIGG